MRIVTGIIARSRGRCRQASAAPDDAIAGGIPEGGFVLREVDSNQRQAQDDGVRARWNRELRKLCISSRRGGKHEGQQRAAGARLVACVPRRRGGERFARARQFLFGRARRRLLPVQYLLKLLNALLERRVRFTDPDIDVEAASSTRTAADAASTSAAAASAHFGHGWILVRTSGAAGRFAAGAAARAATGPVTGSLTGSVTDSAAGARR